jgi:hypothetical protein
MAQMAERLCVLDNLPDAPSSTQEMLLQDQVTNWTVFAVVVPFILLVLIGGWGGTFESGDASAYIVGAAIVAIVENIFQQREDGFRAFRKLLSSVGSEDADAGSTGISWSDLAQNFLIAIGCTAWNLYYAIHDRRVSRPTVDWVQILLFFASLGILSMVRFAGTDYDDSIAAPDADSAWSPLLLQEIGRLHARGVRLIKEAASPRARTRQSPDQLVDAVRMFKSIDDPWCQARAQQMLADAWEERGKPDKACKAREELTKTRQKLEAMSQRHGAIPRVATRGRHARFTQEI